MSHHKEIEDAVVEAIKTVDAIPRSLTYPGCVRLIAAMLVRAVPDFQDRAQLAAQCVSDGEFLPADLREPR